MNQMFFMNRYITASDADHHDGGEAASQCEEVLTHFVDYFMKVPQNILEENLEIFRALTDLYELRISYLLPLRTWLMVDG